MEMDFPRRINARALPQRNCKRHSSMLQRNSRGPVTDQVETRCYLTNDHPNQILALPFEVPFSKTPAESVNHNFSEKRSGFAGAPFGLPLAGFGGQYNVSRQTMPPRWT